MQFKVKDIAKELNISSSSVSLVLHDKPGVSAKTRQAVLDCLERHGFGGLKPARPVFDANRNILFVIYKKGGKIVTENPYSSIAHLIEGINQETNRSHYGLSVNYIQASDHNEELFAHLVHEPPMGILLLATEMGEEDLPAFSQIPAPLVVLDNPFPGRAVDTVAIDNFGGTAQAVSHLIEMGHTDIGYLHSSIPICNFEQRKAGFFEAMRLHALEPDPRLVFSVEPTVGGAYADVCALLERGAHLPSALFADNDIIALGAVRALREHGKYVPKDVSIIGFDNMPFCEFSDPPLSTVQVYKREMGRIAVRRLIEQIEQDTPETVRMVVNTKLIARASVEAKSK